MHLRIKLLVALVLGAAAIILPASGAGQPLRILLSNPSGAAVVNQVASAARVAPTPTPPPAPAPPGTCTLRVPNNALSARGLATPWQLSGAGCHQADPNFSAFVQAAIIQPDTGQVSTYSPLVIDQGTKPAIAPVVPALPDDAVVGIWVGFNGTSLQLSGAGRGRCIDRVMGSIFNQNAFCNADSFFDAAHAAMREGKLAVPALGTARDGKACPTSRDFSIVDQDQSDNTDATYLVAANGLIAQDTPQNRAKLTGAQVQTNGSDERLVAIAVDHALGCTPWTVPDLADPTHAQRIPAPPLNELMAGVRQGPPVALVPALDPFTLINGKPSLSKLNAYRAGVDQPSVDSLNEADTRSYCKNLMTVGLPRIAADQKLTTAAASPFPATANSLFTFLAMRFQATTSDGAGVLNCQMLLGLKTNPVQLTIDNNGVVTAATITLPKLSK